MTDASATRPPSRLARGLRAAVRYGILVAQGLAYAAIVVRIGFRDGHAVTAPLYYAVPPVVAAFVFALAGALDWSVGSRVRPRVGRIALVLLLLAWQGRASWRGHEPRDGAMRVLVWNAAHGRDGWDRIAEEIALHDPELIALVEAHGAVDALRSRLGTHAWVDGGSGMVVGARGTDTAIETERVPLGDGGRALLFTIPRPERRIYGVLVDVVPDPLRHRADAFAHLDRLVALRAPDLIVGDFNTPRDSVFFDTWRPRLRHAFEDAGSGLDTTWPWPLPVLAIDHAWSGPRLEPRACRLVGTTSSDHRIVIAEYAWVGR